MGVYWTGVPTDPSWATGRPDTGQASTDKGPPRPWSVGVGWDGGMTAVLDAEGVLICDCEPHDDYDGDVRLTVGAEAAKFLVLLANDVLPALQGARTALEGRGGDYDPWVPGTDEPVSQALTRLLGGVR